MKRIIEGMLALGIVSLVLITACKKAEITRDETASFLTSVNNLGSDLMQTQTFGVLYDFMSKNPPIGLGKKSFKYKGHEYSLPLKIETRAAKSGIEDFYGTWEWQDTGWVHINPAYPPDGILFQWTFYDTTMTAHQAKVLIDSVETYVYGSDTLPQRLHIAIYLDNTKIADFSFNAQYNTQGQITYLKIVLTIPGEYQIGMEAKNIQYDSNGDLTGITLHFWIINYKNHNFRTDFTITIRSDESMTITYIDSDDWKVVLNFSAPVEVIENSVRYEKVTLTGEITKDGQHAADLRGTIWSPSDATHVTEITIIFNDGTEEPLSNYITITGKK